MRIAERPRPEVPGDSLGGDCEEGGGDKPPVMRMTFPVREGMSVSGLKPWKDTMIEIDSNFRIKTISGVSYVDSSGCTNVTRVAGIFNQGTSRPSYTHFTYLIIVPPCAILITKRHTTRHDFVVRRVSF